MKGCSEETYPLIPSAAIVFLTTSIAPVYAPGTAVCILVFVKSKGCPTRTQAIPPAPPDKNDLVWFTVDLVLTEVASRSEDESDILIVALSSGVEGEDVDWGG